ncbi:Hypothetical_protein [Hexamita inflata]|uniref:Hypothetical_protein n=1 Tax=Hexamita inflata TaxID=28002 RepID=A0AA86P5D9_9EUKA|nr:Hypothetical protein HINF_LOCUS18232 [Hexamita inflata]
MQQCLLKESVIFGRYLVSKFMDFSYTVPLQRRTSVITRLSPQVPQTRCIYLLRQRTLRQGYRLRFCIGTLYQVSPICWILEDYHGLCRPGEDDDDLGQDTVHNIIMAHCSDSGVSTASDFVLNGHFLFTKQTLTNTCFPSRALCLKPKIGVLLGQICETVYDIANGRKGVL